LVICHRKDRGGSRWWPGGRGASDFACLVEDPP